MTKLPLVLPRAEEVLGSFHYAMGIAAPNLVEGLEDLGLKFIVDKQYRLPSLNAVTIPDGIDDMTVRSRLLNDYDIEIGGGLGKFSGKVWRIGLMGHSARKENIEKLLSAFKEIL